MCKYTPWPCKWTITVYICTVTVHRVNDFFILFFSLLSLPLTHLTLFFSFPFSPHSHRSTLSQSWSASPIKYNGDSNRPWKRRTMIPISLSHLRSHENDRLSRRTMIRRSKALTQWTPVIPTGLFYLIVDGGWWLGLGDFGFVLGL